MQNRKDLKIKVLPTNQRMNKAVVSFSTLLNVASLLLIILLPTKRNKDMKGAATFAVLLESLFKFSQPFAAIALSLELHDLRQVYKAFNYQAEALPKEIEKSRTSLLPFFKTKYDKTLKAISLNADNVTQVNYLTTTDAHEDRVRISWELGQGQILQKAEMVKKIFIDLAKFIPNAEFPEFPIALNEKRKYFPYMTQINDFPSKVRALNHYTYIAFIASESLYRMLQRPMNLSLQHRVIMYLCFAMIQWPTNLLDSYVRRDTEAKLNLEGYSHKYPPYNPISTNCIGQQLQQAFVLYPDNPVMKGVIAYLRRSKMVLDGLKLDNMNLPADLMDDIEAFKNIFSEDYAGAKIDFTSNNRQKMHG